MAFLEEEKKVLAWPEGRLNWEKQSQRMAREQSSTCEVESIVTSTLSPYTGTFGNAELLHLLKRTLYGVSKEDVNAFQGKTLTQVLDLLLVTQNTLASQPLNDYTQSGVDAAGVALGEPWGTKVLPMDSGQSPYDNATRALGAIYWNMGLALNMNRTIHEKLCVFWFNHFPVSSESVNRGQRSYVYMKTIRENTNTSLSDMCKKITKDPGMLAYLNGEVNSKTAADENYARELQELFTIGKELPVDKRYSEVDVKAAAKLLTGHRMQAASGFNVWDATYGFSTYEHDTTSKQFSAFYGNKVIAGSTNADTELNALIAMIFDDVEKPSTLQGTKWATWTRADIVADHLVKKMYRFFVSPHITEAIETSIIKPLANTYKQNNFTILPVLRQLLGSQHFFDVKLRGAAVKQPLDIVIGLMRVFAINVNPTGVGMQYGLYREIYQRAFDMGQGYFAPPNIAGWVAYYQSPQYHLLWMNSDTLPKRQDYSKLLIGNGIGVFGDGTYTTIKADYFAFAKKLKTPNDPNALIQELCDLFLGLDLIPAHKEKIKKDHLLSGQTQDYYWTTAWDAAVAGNATTQQKGVVETRLKSLLDYLFRIEEFQLF